jgi:hypothetical protein
MPKQPANHKKNDLQPFTKKTAIELPILFFHFWHRFSRNTAGQAVQHQSGKSWLPADFRS